MIHNPKYEDWYFSEIVTTWEEVREMLAEVEQRREQGKEVLLILMERSSKRGVVSYLFNEKELEDWLNSRVRKGIRYNRDDPDTPLPTEVEGRIASTKFLELIK
jgi:hypothetical protein